MSYPSTPSPSGIDITSITPTLTSYTHSGKRQTRSKGVQRWMFNISYAPLSRADLAPLYAFIIQQKGRKNTFSFTPPVYSNTSGSATGTLTVNGAHTDGDNTITALGLTGTLKAGDYIKFANHDKVYMLVQDGSTSLVIEPPLVKDVPDTTVVTYNNVPFTVALSDDEQGFSRGVVDLHSISVSLEEVIND